MTSTYVNVTAIINIIDGVMIVDIGNGNTVRFDRMAWHNFKRDGEEAWNQYDEFVAKEHFSKTGTRIETCPTCALGWNTCFTQE